MLGLEMQDTHYWLRINQIIVKNKQKKGKIKKITA